MREYARHLRLICVSATYGAISRALLAALLLTAVFPAFASGEEVEKSGAAEEKDGMEFSELARGFRKHCVRVLIHARSADGATPRVGDFGDDIKHERPTLVGGYWWDGEHAVIPDPGVQDRFIGKVEIGVPDGGRLFPARIAGRFKRLQALLVKVLPGEDGRLPQAAPLKFVDGDLAEAATLSYLWRDGDWLVQADSGLGASSRSDSGVETVEAKAQGVLVDADGDALGLAFGARLLLREDEAAASYWRGPGIAGAEFISAGEEERLDGRLRERLAEAVLECRFRIRITMDEEDEAEMIHRWSPDSEEAQTGPIPPEVRAAGLVVGQRRLFVPAALSAPAIRRLEGIEVSLPDGESIPAKFIGALRDYMAVMIEVDRDLPIQSLPPGFTRLNPAAPADDGAPRPRPLLEYIRRWRIDYALGRRRGLADYDRWLGTFRGFRGDTVVLTRTSEEDGHLAFDTGGGLVALALTPRIINSRDKVRGTVLTASPGFRPIDFIREKLLAGDAFDPALAPVDEGQGRRLIDLGVELQPLDVNTARLFRASRETRGGKIGVMLSHVYPGSPAEKIGLREKDILIRLLIEGRKEPMELQADQFSNDFAMDMTSDSFIEMLQFLPPPWPARDNIVSTLLTGAGVGRKAVVEYVRDGETRQAGFETGYFEPDYRSAEKERFLALGLTAKPITFEVQRYFGRKNRAGVIVSKVEEGGKGSVAGLRVYLLVTHVNGGEVAGLEDFAGRVADFENGATPSVELTVEDFGKTRLVKIE